MTSGWAVAALGVATVLVAVLAEALGLGDDPGFGRQQTTMLIAGIIITGIGGYLVFRPPSTGRPDEPAEDDLYL